MDWQSAKVVLLLLSLLHVGQDELQHGFGVQGTFLIRSPPTKVYTQLGDINFGVIDSRTLTLDKRFPCSRKADYDFRFPEVVAYAVEQINKQHTLPNNLTLGFVLLDDCGDSNLAAAQALSLLPQPVCSTETNKNCLQHYDVVAAIGARKTEATFTMVKILETAKIPQIGFFVTNDDLSDSTRFPYFLRNISPNRYVSGTIADIINKYGWNYISVVFDRRAYGEVAHSRIRRLLNRYHVCLAAHIELSDFLKMDELIMAAQELVMHHSRARVVLALVRWSFALHLLRLTRELLPNGTFVWIGINAWTTGVEDMKGVDHQLRNSLLVETTEARVPDFAEWFAQQTPNSLSSPWFHDDWEELFGCSFANGTCNATQTVRDANFTKIDRFNRMGYIADAVKMIASAVSRVLQRPYCRGLVGPAARECVTGDQLLQELKTQQINGSLGLIKLNEYGDLPGQFDIWQLQANSANQYKKVKVFKSFQNQRELKVINKVVWTEDSSPEEVFLHPVSRCSLPCPPHYARIVANVSCCWVCRECGDMQRVINQGQVCDTCPDFTWPDPPYYSKCAPATDTRLRFDSWFGILITTMSLLGAFVCIAIFCYFCYHRQCSLLKATSRELSYFMLLGIFIGYMAAPLHFVYPSDLTCQLKYVLFCMSSNMIKGSLLVRAFNILLSMEMDPTEPPPHNKTRHQLVLAFALLFLQAVMCSFTILTNTEWYVRNQITQKNLRVELTCTTPMHSFTVFTIYNLVLAVLCAIFAFTARDVKDNYHESYFIFSCTSFMLVLYLCLIPAYLITKQELEKNKILVLSVSVCSSGVIVFQFLTKVYALWYGLY